MGVLHLGVLDLPYSAGGKTTGEVADLLEGKYHVIELFVETEGVDAISKAFEESARNALEDLLAGAPADKLSLTLDASQNIEKAFRTFIDRKELDNVEPGVPTQASLKGVNHRLKKPNAKGNSPRPSFRDTGLYQNSFRAWTDE